MSGAPGLDSQKLCIGHVQGEMRKKVVVTNIQCLLSVQCVERD